MAEAYGAIMLLTAAEMALLAAFSFWARPGSAVSRAAGRACFALTLLLALSALGGPGVNAVNLLAVAGLGWPGGLLVTVLKLL